jgi:hypothetical protein
MVAFFHRVKKGAKQHYYRIGKREERKLEQFQLINLITFIAEIFSTRL